MTALLNADMHMAFTDEVLLTHVKVYLASIVHLCAKAQSSSFQ
jgi:hypothetical protein